MPITLITGPANAGKARAVLDRLRRHVADGRRPDPARPDAGRPLLVVPTGADADRYRREIAVAGPAFGTAVCLFSGLMERAASLAAADDATLAAPPLGGVARECLLRTLSREAWPELDGGEGLVRALSAAIAELQSAGVAAGRLGKDALGALQERYVQALREIGRLDVELRGRRALDVLRRRPAAWRAAPVLLYGFDDLSPLQLDAIETLGLVVDAEVTVSLAWEPGREAFKGRARAVEELRPLASEHISLPPRAEHYAPRARAALHHLERSLFEEEEEEAAGVRAGGEGVRAGGEGERAGGERTAGESARPDPGETVRLLEGGSPRAELELLALQARTLVDSGIAPAEIAIVHRSPATIAAPLAEALEALGLPYSIQTQIPFADTALGGALIGLLRCGCTPEEAGLGDLLSWLRAPGVLERPELADRLEERALRSGVRGAAPARKLWESERWPLDRIDSVADAAGRGPLALVDEAERCLRALFLAPRRRAADVLGQDEEGEGLALRAGLGALAELRELASLRQDLLGGPRGLIGALSSLRLASERRSLQDAIAVLDPLSLRARRVRALLLCGLQEGVFPAPGRPEQILTDSLRRRLGQTLSSRLNRRQDALAAERYLLYATVSRPEEHLAISWHAASESGSATPPSLFLDDVCDLFDPSLRTRRRRRALGSADGADALRGAAQARHRPAAQTRHRRGGARVSGVGPLSSHALLDQLRQRRTWSASSLEQWAACPVRWFVERLLGAEGLEPDAEPLARGGLAHAVLSELLQELRGQTGSARLTPQSLPLARRALSEVLARLAPAHPITVEQERAPAVMRRLEADLLRYVEHAAAEQSPLEPTHLELSFGFPDEEGALPALELGDGVTLRGRIDRIDVGEAGEAVIYDYKSGSGGSDYSASKWAKTGRFQMALYMRAAERMLGVDVLGGLYQPLSGSDLRARGALVGDGAVARMEPVRTDSCDRDRLREIVEEVCEQALAATRQAREGALEPRPQTCRRRGGCMYPTICRCGG